MPKPLDLDALADEMGEPLLKMDGFDDCIVGLIYRCAQPTLVCYDIKKILAKLVAQGMTQEEAEEYFDFNQQGAWVGERTPCFLDTSIFDDEATRPR